MCWLNNNIQSQKLNLDLQSKESEISKELNSVCAFSMIGILFPILCNPYFDVCAMHTVHRGLKSEKSAILGRF